MAQFRKTDVMLTDLDLFFSKSLKKEIDFKLP